MLAIAALALAVLGALGTGVDSRLSPTSLDVPGTPSSRANAVLREHFGQSAPFAVLLRGPAAAIDRQGPELVRALRAGDPAVTTLSPWDRGSVGRLRPSPRQALIVIDFHVGLSDSVNNSVDELNQVLDEQVHPPVRATQTGYATLSRAIQDESIAAAERSELIAIPILLLVLLLVFRSPIAAAIPLGFGAVTVASSRGLLYIFASWFDIDAFALTVCTMMGLALGVDYALLMVSRFREEIAGGASPLEAATTTRRTAGRTTAFAGSTLLLSMLVAFFIVPGSLLASLAATVALVVVLSVLVATIAGPALLTLLGSNLDRWRIGRAPSGRSRLMILVTAALRRPAAAAIAIGAVVLILAGPALALKTGPPSPDQLDRSNAARADSELLARSVGPGFESPFVVVAATDSGPITDPEKLKALSRWQRKIAALPGVQAVIGPARVSAAVSPLRRQGKNLLSADGGPLANVGRLGRSLARATLGVGQVRGGILEASYGAGLLAEGSGRAGEGAQLLARGLGRATGGTRRLIKATEAFSAATNRLARVQQRLALGSVVLKTGIHELIPNLRRNALSRSRRLQRSLNDKAHGTLPQLQGSAQVADEQLKAALRELEAMTVGQSDPNYTATLEAVRQASAAASAEPDELAALQSGLGEDVGESQQVTSWLVTGVHELKRLSSLAGRLSDGAQRLEAADRRLAQEAEKLEQGVAPVGDGLSRLAGGATVLAAGIARLTGGTEALSASLGEGYRQSYPLQAGLRRASVRIVSTGASLQRRAARVRASTPGIFDSGYFVLSALDGAAPPLRDRAAEGIDLEHSGQAATLLVFSRYALNSPGSIAFNRAAQPRRGAARPRSGGEDRRRRRPGDAQRLQPRDQGADPARRRGDHPRDLPRPDPDPPLAAAGGDRGRPQPGHRGRRLRHPHDPHRGPRQLAAGRPQLRRLGRRDDDLRDRLRALDRLRGLPPRADAGALRPRRRQSRGDHVRPREDGAGDHRRRGDHDGRLRRLRRRLDRHRQPARRRSHGRRPSRRLGRPHRHAAGADAAARRSGVVVAEVDGPRPAAAQRLIGVIG